MPMHDELVSQCVTLNFLTNSHISPQIQSYSNMFVVVFVGYYNNMPSRRRLKKSHNYAETLPIDFVQLEQKASQK